MFQYQHKKLNDIIAAVLSTHLSRESFEWLSGVIKAGTSVSQFATAFATMPRKTGRAIIDIDENTEAAIYDARIGLHVSGWSVHRLARMWILLNLDPTDQTTYFITIDRLFPASEVNELVALYSSLPVLAFPEMWRSRCAEGIRSNIGDVLTAIMCKNPYPAENLDEAAWNQLVLKAIFTEKPIEQIIGIDLRTNRKLAYTLSDFAHERWAAGRTVNPQLWRCVAPFIDEQLLPDIQKIASSTNPLENEAAALAAFWSNNADAKRLIPNHQLEAIEKGQSTWETLAQKINTYVLQ